VDVSELVLNEHKRVGLKASDWFNDDDDGDALPRTGRMDRPAENHRAEIRRAETDVQTVRMVGTEADTADMAGTQAPPMEVAEVARSGVEKFY
jgi:hypothetical protein